MGFADSDRTSALASKLNWILEMFERTKTKYEAVGHIYSATHSRFSVLLKAQDLVSCFKMARLQF